MNRRKFIKMIGGGLGAVSLGSIPFQNSYAASGNKKILIVFQFGGNDGVNTLIPNLGESNDFQQIYNNTRTNLKLTSGIGLSGEPYFMNNAMSPMQSIWDNNNLSFFPGVGLKDGRASRSHFQASANLLSEHNIGWLAKLLEKERSYRAHSLSGRGGLYAGLSADAGNRVKSDKNPFDDALAEYRGTEEYDNFFGDIIDGSDLFGLSTRYNYHDSEVAKSWHSTQKRALNVAQFASLPPDVVGNFPGGIGKDIKNAARIFKDPNNSTNIITVAHGGYDTHSSQNTRQPGLLSDLSTSLASFNAAMGSNDMADTVVLVISEFGRSINEVANSGTDHGEGALYFSFGGNLTSNIYGSWDLTQEIGGNYFANSVLDSYDVINYIFSRHFGASPFSYIPFYYRDLTTAGILPSA